MLAQDKNLSANLCHYLAFIFWSAMLQNMLNDVVTILILQEAAVKSKSSIKLFQYSHSM